jgi:cold-inducible RNA-binding protein
MERAVLVSGNVAKYKWRNSNPKRLCCRGPNKMASEHGAHRSSRLAPLTFWRSTVGKNIYVGNLAFSATESSISELFSEHGNVDSCRLITDRDTGRSKGFAFVEMSSMEEAQSAISSLDGREVDGRILKINEAKPRESRFGSDNGSRNSSHGEIRSDNFYSDRNSRSSF